MGLKNHSPHSVGGFMPVVIATGIVSMLAALSLTTQIGAGLSQKRITRRLNAIESFYASELAVWHAILRKVGGLAVVATPTGVLLDNNPFGNSSLIPPPDVYQSVPGVPLNISLTRTIAPQEQLVRRYAAGNLTYEVSSTRYCASLKFPHAKNQTHVCVAEGAKPTNNNAPAFFLAWATPNAAGQMELIAMKIRLGRLDSTFNSVGFVTVPVSNTYILAAKRLTDGSLILTQAGGAKRILPTGHEDTTFRHSNPRVKEPFILSAEASSIIFFYYDHQFSERIFMDGSADPNFVSPDFDLPEGGRNYKRTKVWSLKDGRIREAFSLNPQDHFIYQRLPDGRLDTTFGDSNHRVELAGLANDYDEVTEERIHWLGQEMPSTGNLNGYRMLLNGSRDFGFGTNGISPGDRPIYSGANAFNTGDLFFFATFGRTGLTLDSPIKTELHRLFPSALGDPAFGVSGLDSYTLVRSVPMSVKVWNCGLTNDNRWVVVAAGSSTELDAYVRLPGGGPDTSVGENGRFIIDLSELPSLARTSLTSATTIPVICVMDR